VSASADVSSYAAVRGMLIDWTPYFTGAGTGVLSWIVLCSRMIRTESRGHRSSPDAVGHSDLV
jgi:hypothetical protein